MKAFYEFLGGIVLLFFSGGILCTTIKIQSESDYSFIVGPAIFIAILGIILFILAFFWIFQTLRKKGFSRIVDELKSQTESFQKNREFILKFIIILGTSVLYVFVLIPLINFPVATLIFLIVTTLYFGKMKIIHSLMLSCCMSFGLYLFLGKLLHLPLP